MSRLSIPRHRRAPARSHSGSTRVKVDCRVVILTSALWGIGALADTPRTARAQQPPTAATAGDQRQALVKRYCVGCHNDRLKSGSLSFEQLDPVRLSDHADVWEKVVRKL